MTLSIMAVFLCSVSFMLSVPYGEWLKALYADVVLLSAMAPWQSCS
jgi:hypothetical protein